MTTTDDILGATTGLLAVGITAGIAAKMMGKKAFDFGAGKSKHKEKPFW